MHLVQGFKLRFKARAEPNDFVVLVDLLVDTIQT